jgi:hypothetical protein
LLAGRTTQEVLDLESWCNPNHRRRDVTLPFRFFRSTLLPAIRCDQQKPISWKYRSA